MTISGLWKYNLDGSPIEYSVTAMENVTDGRLTADNLGENSGLLPDEKEDYLQALYNNSGVHNHAPDTDAVYNGGALQLILSGETTFQAEKIWLDQNPNEGLNSRPNVTFTLYRYRLNEGYGTAAQVEVLPSAGYGAGNNPTPKYSGEAGDEENPDNPDNSGEGTTEPEIEYYYYEISSGENLPKYDADGYVRGYDKLEGTYGLADGDPTDGYINDVAALEKALEEKDTVLLDQDFTVAHGILTFENGTLYTDTDKTEGININPDVKVVLALADKNKKPFDDVDDGYTGYSGLEKALRNLDTEATDTNGDGVVDYNFNGNLAAIVEGGDGATTIILDDRSGKVNNPYNPLEAMTVTVNMIDNDTNRNLGSYDIKLLATDTIYANDARLIGYLDGRFGDGSDPVPAGDSHTVTFVEGDKTTITFYYGKSPVVTGNAVQITADGAFVEIGGIEYSTGTLPTRYEGGQVLVFKVNNDPNVDDPASPVVKANGSVISPDGSGNYRLSIVDGKTNTIEVTVKTATYTLDSSVTTFNTGNWEVVDVNNIFGKSYAAGTKLSFVLRVTDTWMTSNSDQGELGTNYTATITGLTGATQKFTDGTDGSSAVYTKTGKITDKDSFEVELAKSVETSKALYQKNDGTGTVATSFDDWSSTMAYMYYVSKEAVDGTPAEILVTFTMPTNAVDITAISIP